LVRNLWFIVPVNPYQTETFSCPEKWPLREASSQINLLAAFGLDEFKNKKGAINAEKNVASGEQSNIEQSNKK